LADIEAMEDDRLMNEAARRYRASRLDALPPGLRRIVVGLIGGSTLLLGVAMIALPGPSIVVIPLGLGILGTEFAWARRLIMKGRGVFSGGKRGS
jgi:hypothetical protein